MFGTDTPGGSTGCALGCRVVFEITLFTSSLEELAFIRPVFRRAWCKMKWQFVHIVAVQESAITRIGNCCKIINS